SRGLDVLSGPNPLPSPLMSPLLPLPPAPLPPPASAWVREIWLASRSAAVTFGRFVPSATIRPDRRSRASTRSRPGRYSRRPRPRTLIAPRLLRNDDATPAERPRTSPGAETRAFLTVLFGRLPRPPSPGATARAPPCPRDPHDRFEAPTAA